MSGALTVSWREVPAAPAAAASSYVDAVRRLDSLVFDGETENLRVLLGGGGENTGAYLSVAADLDRFLVTQPGFAWAHALKGKALLNAGDAARGRSSLDAALRLDAGLAQAYLWRAQAALLSGDHAFALDDLKRHDALAGGGYWSHFLRGVALSFTGDGAGAAREWKRTLKWAPGSVASRAMLGLGEAGRGNTKAASRLLDDAARSGGRNAGYVLALKGLVERQRGDLEGSRDSLDRAIAVVPSPWMYSHRADVLNRLGFYKDALQDLKQLSELTPDQPQAYVQAANVLFDQAFYDEALKMMDAALTRAPGEASLHARKARILWVSGDTEGAWLSAEEARRLSPADPQIAAEWAQLAAVTGRESRAREELNKKQWKGNPLKDLYLGLAAGRKGNSDKARRLFLSARKSAITRQDVALAERADLYALVMKLSKPSSARLRRLRVEDGLHLVSVGIRHPFQATVESIEVLASCKEIFNNVSDPQIAEFLALFPGKTISVPRRMDKSTDEDRASWILDRVEKGTPVAFLTRIHPFIYRRIGYDLARLSRERGLPMKAYGAFSLTELAPALAGGASASLQVFDVGHLVSNPSWLKSGRAALIYCIGMDDRPGLARLLAKAYPGKHQAWLLGGAGDRETAVTALTVRGLAAALEGADGGSVIYLPAAVDKGDS